MGRLGYATLRTGGDQFKIIKCEYHEPGNAGLNSFRRFAGNLPHKKMPPVSGWLSGGIIYYRATIRNRG